MFHRVLNTPVGILSYSGYYFYRQINACKSLKVLAKRIIIEKFLILNVDTVYKKQLDIILKNHNLLRSFPPVHRVKVKRFHTVSLSPYLSCRTNWLIFLRKHGELRMKEHSDLLHHPVN